MVRAQLRPPDQGYLSAICSLPFAKIRDRQLLKFTRSI
jgi:hypothetical protein